MSKRQLFKKLDVSGNVEDLGYTLTAEEVTKLSGIEDGAEKNKVNSVNGKIGDIVLSASDVDALSDDTVYGANLSLTINTSTYVVTAQLKDQNGNDLGTAQTIDLPLESVVVSGSYDATNKKVILTLKDGSTVGFSVADLVRGLVSDTTTIAGIDLKDNITSAELSNALNLSQYTNTITSVNGKTGIVSLTAEDVGALPKSGGDVSGDINFTNSSAWLTPYLLAFKNADTSQSPAHPYTGFYQWGSEWQVNARDANNKWAKNLMTINLDTAVATFGARPTVNGANIALQSDIPGSYIKSASVSDNKLTLTKQDDSTIEFKGSSGGGIDLTNWNITESSNKLVFSIK